MLSVNGVPPELRQETSFGSGRSVRRAIVSGTYEPPAGRSCACGTAVESVVSASQYIHAARTSAPSGMHPPGGIGPVVGHVETVMLPFAKQSGAKVVQSAA